ncbi:MAG: Fe-S cluster assembly protein SufD [Bacteroidetes bacterium]|nr:Fe-S cluster assembly protein SufD [Bacteroidota bacterium]MDA1119899.1 Fe-S cluster assembly protein SufD [Bacteroidota bacterium]
MGKKLNEIFASQFQSFENRLNGEKQMPVHKLRKDAFEALQSTGLPDNKNEEYRFTRLTTLLERSFNLSQQNPEQSLTKDQIDGRMMKDIDGSSLVFLNGVYSKEQSVIASEHQDITIDSLQDAIKYDSECFEHYFNKTKSYGNDGFLSWNTAFTETGVKISVESNRTYEKPIVLNFITDATGQQFIGNPRILIQIGENSEITFLENFKTIGDFPAFNNLALEIISEKASRVKYIKIQDDGDNTIHMSNSMVYQTDACNVSMFAFTFSGKMVRNNLNVVVDGEGCEANMYGLYLLNGTTHADNHTVVDHRKPNSVSNELYKGILDDKSRGVFNGKIYVRQLAQKTNAFQSNNNILLSNDATINTKPQLEIWADDVKCSHGCTTGQLDDEQLFYLRSRGIDKDRAIGILLQAFANDIFDKTPVKELRSYLEEIVMDRLN